MRRPGIILTFNGEESNKTPLGVAVGKKERKEALRLSRKDAAVLASAAAANFLSLSVPAALQPGTHAERLTASKSCWGFGAVTSV
jgi:hypothetical protein